MLPTTHGKVGAICGLTILVLLAGCASSSATPSGDGEAAPPAFELSGTQLKRPEGFHEWVHVGTAVTPDAMNNDSAPFPGFHSVYLDNASFTHWQSNGEFRDGAVLVKQLTSIGSTEEVSGKGYFMGDFGKLEVAVKSPSRFPDAPGHWAYYEFEGEEKWATLKANARCNACHQGAATHDFVFTEHYPILHDDQKL